MTKLKCFKTLLANIYTIKKLKRAQWYLEREKPIVENFFDLAPVDNADIDGLYGKALDFAMRNSAVRNVAITGPYGSGKTSVIKTYEKNSPYSFLNISLATFSDPNFNADPGSSSSSDEITVKIERSILQQMLYGSETSALPYSRFKRISKPRWLNVNAAGFAFWIIICFYLYRERGSIFGVTSLHEIKPLWAFSALYAVSYFTQLIARALRASHSLSVKRLSLQNGEVELDGTPESSILNKHLDEIIYFFEEKNYDAVIFEDLDRFGSPEIFIKLREINKIINDRPRRRAGAGILKETQPLKFIYAIKDDVFFNKDRAKFFDFITPIVPIINNSNSREMLSKCMTDRGDKQEIDNRLLGDVSLYLDDYRLIKNISNEFLIYQSKVGGVPNLSKLFAMIVYKNTYPKDFEALHHGKGALLRIVELRTQLIARAAAETDVRIETLRQLIRASEAEICSAQEDLVRIFWGQLCGGNTDYNIKFVYAENEALDFQKLLEWDNFRKLYNEKSIRVQALVPWNGQFRIRDVEIGSSFREIEELAIPGTKFEVRYERIKNKSSQRRSELNNQIEALKEEKSELARKPLRDLLKAAESEIDEIASSSEIGDFRLLNYLIRNGYLDETYHLYISIFHEGRMSRNDWNFIQTIRDFRSVDPLAPIDTPSEVVAEMRDEDFGAEYVLNVPLVDYLLTSEKSNRAKIISAVEFISKRFADSEGFFQAYWLSGRSVDRFTRAVAENWPGYGIASINSDQAPRHIALIISHVSPSHIATNMNPNGVLSRYLSTHAPLVFSENISFTSGYEALKLLRVEIEELQALAELDDVLSYVYENSLYAITVENINYAILNLLKEAGGAVEPELDPRKSNYTAISAAQDRTIKAYIYDNIDTYLEDVGLAIDSNTEESKDSILEILNHPEADPDLATQFALKQSYIFENLKDAPDYIWRDLLFSAKVVINWANILTYFLYENSDHDRLNEMLDRDEVVNKLVGTEIPMSSQSGDDDSRALSLFIIQNTNIDISNYTKLIACSPYIYKNFPSGNPQDRNLSLARLGKVSFNEESFASTASSSELRAALIQRHISKYLPQAEKYPLDIAAKLILLKSLTGSTEKASIFKMIKLDELQSGENVVPQVSRYLATRSLDTENHNRDLVAYCLANCSLSELVIEILYNFIDLLSDQEITSALRASPEPYCQFIKANTRQKLDRTDRNLDFVRKLDRRNIVSSISEENDTIRVNAYRKGVLKILFGE